MNLVKSTETIFDDQIVESEIAIINERKHFAKSRLDQIGFPSRKDEDWKYFDFQDIFNLQISHHNHNRESREEINALIEKHCFQETIDGLLVTVNGEYVPELSNFNFSKEEINVINFNDPKQLDERTCQIIEKCFAINRNDAQFFKLTNTVLMKTGFLLAVKANISVSKTIQVLHISTGQQFNQMRSLIYLEEDSNLNLIVTYAGLNSKTYFTNAVIEAYLETNSKLKLDRIQNESQDSICIYDLHATLNNSSHFRFNSFSFGALSSKEQITVDINGEEASAHVNGLFVSNQNRKSHHQVTINHNAPKSSSEQLFKGLLQGNSRAEFNGLINVNKNATQTNAEQLNKNILLSTNAHIDTRPQLNILTDDVKCSHGATVGRLDDEEFFYLMSRGLTEDEARVILTYSFSQELIKQIQYDSVRNHASNLVFKSLQSTSNNNTLDTLADNSRFKQSRHK